MFCVDVAWDPSIQSPTKKSIVVIICLCEIQCFQCHHSELQFYQLVSSLLQIYIVWSCCIYLEVACDQVSRVPGCPEQQRILPMWWTLVSIKKIQWFLKILQAQVKRWKYKAHSVSHHLRISHNLMCNPCLCLKLKGPRWIGLWMIACTIHLPTSKGTE